MPSYRRHYGWHKGELEAQQRLGYAAFLQGVDPNDDHMDSIHASFHSSLCYVAIATLDDLGRPWGSLLCRRGERGFISSPNAFTLEIDADRLPGDPAFDNLKTCPLVAGVGTELLNRRRNKFAGYTMDSSDESSLGPLKLRINSTLGNCPKYINVRELVSAPEHRPEITARNDDMQADDALPPKVLKHIREADSVYLSTAFLPADSPEEHALGMNHRGGRPGFIRTDPKNRNTLYLPDFSGNRFMQSIGNIVTYPKAGLVIPDWKSGNVLYLTGDAQLYFGSDANKIMRSVHAVTELKVTGYRFVKQGLPLKEKGETLFSLYNPPVRTLTVEGGEQEPVDDLGSAQLDSCRFLSDSLGVFTFRMQGKPSPPWQPGQYAVLDCSALIHPSSKAYKHMARPGEEKTLNDDGRRSWTISDWRGDCFDITMRMKPDGIVTPMLFAFGQAVNDRNEGVFAGPTALAFPLVGVAGTFVLDQAIPKQIYLAAGVGVTPMLAFLRHITKPLVVHLLVSVRAHELAHFEDLVKQSLQTCSAQVTVTFHVTDRQDVLPDESGFSVKAGRISKQTLTTIPVPEACTFWICGNSSFRTSMNSALVDLDVAADQINFEDFAF